MEGEKDPLATLDDDYYCEHRSPKVIVIVRSPKVIVIVIVIITITLSQLFMHTHPITITLSQLFFIFVGRISYEINIRLKI